MNKLEQAARQALEALIKANHFHDYEDEITALREALARDHSVEATDMVQGEWVDLTDDEVEDLATNWFAEEWAVDKAKGLIDDFLAKFKERNTPPVVPQGEHKTDGSPCWCNPEVTYENPETGAKVIVHKEPQDEWVDLTDSELEMVIASECIKRNMAATDHHISRAVIAKFKEKNTPPVVPQGEPVYAFRRKGLDDFCTCDERRYLELSDKPNLFETTIFYTTPPSVEAAIEATKEKAAKVCEATRIERIKSEWDAGHETGCSSCAAAIRSMK